MGISAQGICTEHREELSERLKRIQGQIGGVVQMVEANRGCLDILNQVSAARAGLGKAGAIVIEHHLKSRLSREAQSGSDELAEELKRLIHKLIQ